MRSDYYPTSTEATSFSKSSNTSVPFTSFEQEFKRVIIELSFCEFIQTNHSFDLFSDALDSTVPELPSQILVVRDVVPGGFEPRVLASLGLWARILVATIRAHFVRTE